MRMVATSAGAATADKEDKQEKKEVQDLWIVPVDGSAKPRRLTSGKGAESGAAWSPDGRRLALVERHLAGEGIADGDVVQAERARLHAPLALRPRRRVLYLGQGQVVVADVAVLGHPAVKAHLQAPGTGLERGHTLEADDLGPELVRELQVAHVQDEVVHSPRRLGLRHGILRGGPMSVAGNRGPYGNTEPDLTTGVC